MKRLLFLTLLGVSAAASLAGCGDDAGPSVTCGAGTTIDPATNTCVAGGGSECGPGTVLMGDTCVPDGSMICDQGTVFDTVSGQCVVDPSVCADGTVFVGGECVPEDETIVTDLEEAAEPNDDAGAGMFMVPEIDQDITFHGCVTPGGEGVRDFDPWVITATGPTVLEITADGVGGLAAGFVVVEATGAVALENYRRFGINLSGDTSKRQVYLPLAGTYILAMDDSRALLLGEAAGNSSTCYYTTVKTIALPTATAVTIPQTTASDSGNVKVFSFAPTAIGDIFDVNQSTASSALTPSFVLTVGGVFQGMGFADAPYATVGGLNVGDAVQIIVDNELNYALAPQDYALDMFQVTAQALPTTGSPVLSVTMKNGNTPNATYWDRNYFYFDVSAANQVVFFDLTMSLAVDMVIHRKNIFNSAGGFDAVAVISSRATFPAQYVRFLQPGRYYLSAFRAGGMASATYTLTSTVKPMATVAATYGTPMTAQALSPQGANFYSLDLQAANEWAQLGVVATDWGTATTVRSTLYNLAGEGWLGSTGAVGYPNLGTGTQPVDGSVPLGRIVFGDPLDYLIQIQDTGTPGPAPMFTLDIRERTHVNLGTIVSGTPINRVNDAMDNLAATGVQRYLVTGTAGHRLNVAATPDQALVDITIARRNVNEGIVAGGVTNGGPGEADVLNTQFSATPTWLAFTVTNNNPALATGVDFGITSVAPIPYADICATGTTLPAPFDGNGDDEFAAVQALPLGYTYYGLPVTEFIVAANGFLVFGNANPTCSSGCYVNSAIPNSNQPNNMIAPYWDDLDTIKVCRKDAATTVTIQWTGFLYFSTTAIEMQAIIHQDGTVDLVFGAGHLATGSAATVGVENSDGSAAKQAGFNTAGTTSPVSSYTFTTP